MKGNIMASPDPIEALAIGVAEDHKAGRSSRRSNAKKDASKDKSDDTPPVETPDAAPPTEPVNETQAVVGAVQQAITDGAVADVSDAVATAVNEVPAAPGDDPESVFDRRLARLTTIAEESEFDTGTAFGDLRDCLLDLFKTRPKLWAAMTPSERNGVVRHIEGVARQVLHKVVLIIAQDGDDTISGTLDKKWTVNGETLEAKVKIDNADNETLADLFKVAGHRVVIVSADAVRFMQARRSQDQGEDQGEIPFADPPAQRANEAPPAPSHPADDSDLADGYDDTAGTADAQASADDPARNDWGVFDNTDNEWLVTVAENGGPDEWSANSGEAVRLPEADAHRIAEEYGEGFVARLLGDDDTDADAAQD